MNNYEELVGIKTHFENSTEADLHNYLYSFETKWVHSGNKNVNNLVNKALDNFGNTCHKKKNNPYYLKQYFLF